MEADEFDAEYTVERMDPEQPLEFHILRKPCDGTDPEFFIWYRGSLNIEAFDFTSSEGLEIDAGWSFGTKDFRDREDPQNDAVKWYVDGEPVEYRDGEPLVRNDGRYRTAHTAPNTNKRGRLYGKARLADRKTLSVLGEGSFENREGYVSIHLGKVAAPPEFSVDNQDGSFGVNLTLGENDFRSLKDGLSKTGRLNIELSGFIFRTMLVRRDGSDYDNIFWVPYIKPFHELYAHLDKTLGDAKIESPKAGLSLGHGWMSIGPRAKPDAPSVEEVQYAALKSLEKSIEQVSAKLTALRLVNSRLNGQVGWVLFLLVVIIIVNILF